MTDNAMKHVPKDGKKVEEEIPVVCLAPRGLAIYPVRYAVVPNTLNATLPNAMGDGVDEVSLSHHKYALRRLREGFIYVYYHDHPENKKWDIYQVNEQGIVRELDVAQFKQGENEIILSYGEFFYIDQPDQIAKVDFAFSEHAWSPETLKDMEADKDGIRNRRMQTFRPQNWIRTPYYPHGLPVTEDHLKYVIEYSEDYDDYSKLFYTQGQNEPKISDDNGVYNSKTLHQNITDSYMTMRDEQERENLVNSLHAMSTAKNNSTRNQPMMLALWDHVGIARELNGFAMDAATWLDTYSEKWQREINAIQNIDNAEKAIKQVATKFFNESDDAQRQISRGSTEKARELRKLKEEKTRLKRILKRLKGEKTPQAYDYHGNSILAKWLADITSPSDEHRATRIKHVKERLEEIEKQLPDLEKEATHSLIAHRWEKYELEIDRGKLESFRTKHMAIASEAETLLNQRVQDLIAWLKHDRFADALAEYHKQSQPDGLFFEDLIGDLITAIAASDAGDSYLNELLAECAFSEKNLIWRAFVNNQSQTQSTLEPVLALAKAQQTNPLDEKTILGVDEATYSRLKEYLAINKASYALAQELKNSNGRAIPTGGVDKIYNALGGRLFNALVKTSGVDSVGLFIIKLVYQTKARINIEVIAQHYKLHLNKLANSFRTNKFNPYIEEIERINSYDNESLYVERKKALFKMGKKAKAFNKARMSFIDRLIQLKTAEQDRLTFYKKAAKSPGTALGILVIAMEGFALQQLLADIKNDPEDNELKAQLLITTTALASTAAGITEAFTKSASVWNMGLKAAGGGLAAVTGILSAALDFNNAKLAEQHGNHMLKTAYVTKGYLNIGASGISFTAIVTAVSSNIEKALAIRLSPYLGYMVRDITTRLVLTRFLMAISLWLGIIMLFDEDSLEDWLEQTPFADSDNKNDSTIEKLKFWDDETVRFDDANAQQAAFNAAILGIFGIEKEQKETVAPLISDSSLSVM